MDTLCFGGSFNPIHHGHLLCARAVAEVKGFKRVLLIPSAQPPHKLQKPGQPDVAPAEDRLAMCRLAVEGSKLFDVSDLELRRRGPSYTIDTARQLKAQGLPVVHWLIGGDTLPQLPSWHEADALLEEVHFVVMARPGWSLDELDGAAFAPSYRTLRANLVPAPMIDISATAIRARVRTGRSLDYLTPPAVTNYISGRSLYR